MADALKTAPLNDIYRTIQSDLDAVEGYLKELGGSANPLIAEINKYLFEKSGKRIRPALLILSAKLCGYQGRDHIFWSALVEIIHTASLIHDDIVDNSTLRRGQDTVHTRWGANITVLLGDFLYIQSIAMALKTRTYDLIDILADVTAQMIEGELIEYSMSGHAELSEEIYLEIINKKTAQLFANSCQIGGRLAGASAEETRRLKEFGLNLGLAFQIVDDLLDYSGDPATLGKPVLSDIREGRVTLPLIHALRKTKGEAREELVRGIRDRAADRNAAAKILEAIAATASLDHARGRAAAYIARAKKVLDAFPASEHRASLDEISDLVLRRKK
jgi:octaprenyl-diphosphate synthase